MKTNQDSLYNMLRVISVFAFFFLKSDPDPVCLFSWAGSVFYFSEGLDPAMGILEDRNYMWFYRGSDPDPVLFFSGGSYPDSVFLGGLIWIRCFSRGSGPDPILSVRIRNSDYDTSYNYTSVGTLHPGSKPMVLTLDGS